MEVHIAAAKAISSALFYCRIGLNPILVLRHRYAGYAATIRSVGGGLHAHDLSSRGWGWATHRGKSWQIAERIV